MAAKSARHAKSRAKPRPTKSGSGGATDPVAAQYEALPYPERDPQDERRRLIAGSPSDLWELNHYLFGGARDWSRPFRALIAGGGTGDAAIMLGQQLADAGVDARVLHLDVSAAAQAVARARAEVRGLGNIDFRQGSLLDLTAADGPFDYIDCCGVLHHLTDPAAGLDALVGVMAPDGGIGLMVYGALGRIGVYHAQEALRVLAPTDLAPADRLDHARRLLKDLPETNWLVRNPFVADHLEGGDAGLYDLLLHERDRAYRVGELLALLDGAGLRTAAFIEPSRYDPASYLKDPKLQRRAAALDDAAAAGLAELLAGNMNRHIVYACRGDNQVAPPRPDDAAAVPVLRDVTPSALVAAISANGRFRARHAGLELTYTLPPLAKPILERCNGTASLAAIHRAIAEMRSDLDWDLFQRQFGDVYHVFNGINRMHLKLR